MGFLKKLFRRKEQQQQSTAVNITTTSKNINNHNNTSMNISQNTKNPSTSVSKESQSVSSSISKKFRNIRGGSKSQSQLQSNALPTSQTSKSTKRRFRKEKKDKKSKNAPLTESDKTNQKTKTSNNNNNSPNKSNNEPRFLHGNLYVDDDADLERFTGTSTNGSTRASSLSREPRHESHHTIHIQTNNNNNKTSFKSLSPTRKKKITGMASPTQSVRSEPVDLDDTDFDDSGDENQPTAANRAANNKSVLTHQQLQQFNRSHHGPTSNRTASPHKNLYQMTDADDQDPLPISKPPSDCSSSDFNLSTDAEDTEYNNLRKMTRSKEATTMPSKYIQTATHQVGTLEAMSSPNSYNTDPDANIFPALHMETESPPKTLKPTTLLSAASSSFKGEEEDMRAWNPPTHTKSASAVRMDPPGGFDDFANFDDHFSPSSSTDIHQTSSQGAAKSQKIRPPRTSHSFDQDISNTSNGFSTSSRRTNNNSNKYSSSASVGHSESPLQDLLAQAKEKRSSRSNRQKVSASSVNSAPVITAAYLRQQHNLPSSNGMSKSRSGGEATSVSDIIQNLEQTNQAHFGGGKSSRSRTSANNSVAGSSVRSAKERLRAKRRKERQLRSSCSDDSTENEDFLMNEVTHTLGPRGAAADMESLSGRSKTSTGNKSHKSYRSSRSKGSKSTRRSSHQHKPSSDNSLGSKGSRSSRHSRSSRYSHKSTRSYLSHMSEQSKSVANDLLRLEMQLAMVGSTEVPQNHVASGSISGSIGGHSRASRASSRRSERHRSNAAIAGISKRTKVNVSAPPGKLGIILANKADSKGTVVSGVRTSSVLVEKICPGDRIIAIDGEDVSRMTVSEITTIMARKSEFERVLTILTTPKIVTAAPKDMDVLASTSALRQR